MSRPVDFVFQATLSSHPRYILFVRTLAGEAASAAGFTDDERARVELAVVEGFTNVIRHAYHDHHDQPIALRLRAPDGLFSLEIEDRARFADPTKFASRPLDQIRPGGLGVHLMKTTMDVVDYRQNEFGGTTLTLTKRRPGGPA